MNYSTCLGLALSLGWYLWTAEALQKHWIRSSLRSPAPLLILFGILGAKALATLGEWERYGATLFEWGGPLAVQGAMLTSGAGFYLWARRRRLPALAVLDALARSLAAMLIPIRLGCYFAGCCQGAACALPWATADAAGVARHPTQLYEALLGLILVLLLRSRPLRNQAAGTATWVFLVVYGAARAGLELLRVDTEPLFLGVSYPQVIAVGMLLFGARGLRTLRRADSIRHHEVNPVLERSIETSR